MVIGAAPPAALDGGVAVPLKLMPGVVADEGDEGSDVVELREGDMGAMTTLRRAAVAVKKSDGCDALSDASPAGVAAIDPGVAGSGVDSACSRDSAVEYSSRSDLSTR